MIVKIGMNHHDPNIPFIVTGLEYPNSRFIDESFYFGREIMEFKKNEDLPIYRQASIPE
ncbi:MAG: hypothetical protein WCZ43_00605 [Proteiniphilum sp.]